MGSRHIFTLPLPSPQPCSCPLHILSSPFPLHLLVPLPAMRFPPLFASLTPTYSPDLNSGMISLGESSPRPLVDQILHYKLSLHKSLYSNMLSYLKFYKALYDYKCDEELTSPLDCKFLRQAPCQCLLITRSSAPSTLPGMKEVHYDIFKRIVNE